jgi:phospholipid/cholesterol/gamma-HCH transport system substrate-binding protein
MNARTIVMTVLAFGALVAVLAVRDGADPYEVKMRMDNAGGLRPGSPVVVGGLPIGVVDLEASRDHVDVTLEIDEEHAPIPVDTRAEVIAQNVLGQKQVQLRLGRDARSAPSGWTIPAARVDETTDLDQLLATLDADTRARLRVLVHESGTAFAGRRLDLSTWLKDFAPAIADGGALLGELTRDNRALAQLLEGSDRYLAVLADDRRDLGRALDAVADTTETVAARRAELAGTLDRAPAALRSARGFLAELRATTEPLAATSRELVRVAAEVRTTLARIDPFRRDATPLLDAARAAGPDLTRLASRLTPVLQRATPVVEDTRAFVTTSMPPVSRTLDRSMNNFLATVENWSRAIQFRDRLSHIFRGEASIAPDLLDAMLHRLVPASERRARGPRRPARRDPARPATPAPSAPAPATASPRPTPRLPALPQVLDDVGAVIESIVPPRDGEPARRPSPSASPLLDYLLQP